MYHATTVHVTAVGATSDHLQDAVVPDPHPPHQRSTTLAHSSVECGSNPPASPRTWPCSAWAALSAS